MVSYGFLKACLLLFLALSVCACVFGRNGQYLVTLVQIPYLLPGYIERLEKLWKMTTRNVYGCFGIRPSVNIIATKLCAKCI